MLLRFTYTSNETFSAGALLRAMAPIEDVLASFAKSCKSLFQSEESWVLIDGQDHFGNLVQSHWYEFGPSERYLKHLVLRYVAHVEKLGVDVESDVLLSLVLKASCFKNDIPNEAESCYLSFNIRPPATTNNTNDSLLRLRIFPYHNDVALRLWEAGACLAEFFLENTAYVAGKNVVELGAGVGCTGLAIAGLCKALSVHMTDFTDVCLTNLAHNLEINKPWLACHAVGVSPTVSQSYLEWKSFAEKSKKWNQPGVFKDDKLCASATALSNSDVLIAADVIYDVATLESLVAIVRFFLSTSNGTKKHAIFALTKRNMKSFNTFMGYLKTFSISCQWLARSSECGKLPIVFPHKFNQPRSDVCIASMKYEPSTRVDEETFYNE